jgi:hypothetical protein
MRATDRTGQNEIFVLQLDIPQQPNSHIETVQGSPHASISSFQATSLKSGFEFEKQEAAKGFMVQSRKLAQNVCRLRSAHKSRLAQLCQLQADELSELSTDLTKNIELCITRSTPEVDSMLHIAQINANHARYSQANSIASDAYRLKAEIHQWRLAALQDQYSSEHAEVIARYHATDARVEAKLAADIQQVHAAHRKLFETYKQQIIASAAKHDVAISESEATEMLEKCQSTDDPGPPVASAPSDR